MRYFKSILLFFIITSFLHAQADAPREVRIVWSGGEHALRYAVEIDRLEDGVFRNSNREFTETLYLNVSLQPGEYRYRVIPHDVLDRPGQGTQWIRFEVRPRQENVQVAEAAESEPALVVGQITENNEQITENNEQRTELLSGI